MRKRNHALYCAPGQPSHLLRLCEWHAADRPSRLVLVWSSLALVHRGHIVGHIALCWARTAQEQWRRAGTGRRQLALMDGLSRQKQVHWPCTRW